MLCCSWKSTTSLVLGSVSSRLHKDLRLTPSFIFLFLISVHMSHDTGKYQTHPGNSEMPHRCWKSCFHFSCCTAKRTRMAEEAGHWEKWLKVPVSPQREPGPSLTLTQRCSKLYFLTCLILVFMPVVSFYFAIFFPATPGSRHRGDSWLGTFSGSSTSASHN